MTPIIEGLSNDLIAMGVSIFEVYELTPNEMSVVLTQKRKQLGYELWKQANLIGAMFSKQPPKSAEEACEELYPKKEKPRIPMPIGLAKAEKEKEAKNGKH